MTQFLSAHSYKPPRQFQPQIIHGLFLGLFGTPFCQVKVYRRADQRMFLAIGEAIAVQQIGLLPLGQPFQAIVQFPARFLLLHNALRLHGVGVGYGFKCAAAALLPAEHRPAKRAGSRRRPCPPLPSAAQKQ